MHNTSLFKKDSKGKIREWKAFLTKNQDNTVTINIVHGQQSGKFQTKTREVLKGKNIGKANETTVEQQAELELQSLYQKQLDDGYVTKIEDYRDPVKPMLAHKYQDRSKHVLWKSEEHPEAYQYASAKYDGIRCFIIIQDGKIRFESRSGKPFKYFEHIAKAISHLDNVILDGELYSWIESFEKICSLVNSDDYNKDTDTAIQFFIYDMINLEKPDEPFKNRYANYSKYFLSSSVTDPVQHVWQIKIINEDDLKHYHCKWVEEGYEGLMLKDPNGKYEFGKRSNSLLKYKVMFDGEFKITNIYLAANDPTRVQIELQNDINDMKFDIGTLKGNKEENYNFYYINKEKLIGKYLNITYQARTSYGIPLFPVGQYIREGDEINGKFEVSM